MKILTYNLNGIRSALNKELIEFLQREAPDIVCFQELKAQADQFDESLFSQLGYHCIWYPAEKKGYSGVGILSKIKPNNIQFGCNHALYDHEGRIVRTDYDKFSVISAYFPSGSSGDHRQVVKMEFLDYIYHYIQGIKTDTPPLIICGDFNICHEPIDIHDPVGNKNSSGFLPEERAWMSAFLKSGFVDSFRSLHPGLAHQYTWWSFRANARNNNKGWRIDYIMVDERLKELMNSASILPDDRQSDHCASFLEINL